jgi:hypothetical protein
MEAIPTIDNQTRLNTVVQFNNTINFYAHLKDIWTDLWNAKKRIKITINPSELWVAYDDWYECLKEIYLFGYYFWRNNIALFEKIEKTINELDKLTDNTTFFLASSNNPDNNEITFNKIYVQLFNLQKNLFLAQGELNMLLSIKKLKEYQTLVDEIDDENI